MMKKILLWIICLVIGSSIAPGTCFAVTAQQLREMLGGEEKLTLIDIRKRVIYTQNHILGAINIPAGIILKKRLPPLGKVIVYGDGINTGLTRGAADALNKKPGINAEILEGGFSAWETFNLPITGKKGLGVETYHYLSYRNLKKAAAENPDLILVDLRHRGENTNLLKKFPGASAIKLTRKPGSGGKRGRFDIEALIDGKSDRHSKLYVLIDNGDGEAEKIAHHLKAVGIRRVVIMTGGEIMLRRDGKPGLKTKKNKR